jgi:hypothetical protein
MIIRFMVIIVSLLSSAVVIAADFQYEGLKLGSSLKSLPKSDYMCSPSPILKGQIQCNKNNPGQFMGVSANKAELMYKKDRLYVVFIGINPNDVLTVRKALEQKYGRPKTDKQLLKGVYQTTWQSGDTELVLNKATKRGTADVTMMDYKLLDVK